MEGVTDPILVISDLHGNYDLLRLAVAEGLRLAQGCGLPAERKLPTVLLGDYLDNGPDVVSLVEYLSSGAIADEFPQLELHCILGNHDLAGLLAFDPTIFGAVDPVTYGGEAWICRWMRHWNTGGNTAAQYIGCREGDESAMSAEAYAEAYRAALGARPQHFRWLEARPLCLSLAGYLFVHAGLRPGVPLEEQVELLTRADPLSPDALRGTTFKRDWYTHGYGMPDQIVSKDYAQANDPAWGQVVVTGHHKFTGGRDFIASHRLGLHSGACEIPFRPGTGLHCALLQANAANLDVHPPLCFEVLPAKGSP